MTNTNDITNTELLKGIRENFLLSYGMKVIAKHLAARDEGWKRELQDLGYSEAMIAKSFNESIAAIEGMLILSRFTGNEAEVRDVLKEFNQ